MNEFTNKILGIFGIFIVITVAMWGLWNWVMPELGLPQLGYFKFLGLTTLLYAILPGGASSKIARRE